RRGGDDLEVRGYAEARHGGWHPVVVEGERTAVVLVADDPALLAEHIPPVEVGPAQRPVVGAPDGVAAQPARDAQPEAMIPAEEEGQPGEPGFGTADDRARPQAGREVPPRRIARNGVLGLGTALVRHDGAAADLPT